MNKKNININNFYVIISLLTLVIMLVGATFAYFSTVVKADDPISVSSVDIRLELNIRPLYNGLPLLPTNDDDINLAYQNECKDSYGNGACTAYTVEIKNTGGRQEIISTLKIDNENYKNLKYILINPENNSIYQDITSVSTTPTQLGEIVELDSGESKEFILLIWISNLVNEQDYEQGQEFVGIITVDTAVGIKLTGTISENIG